MLNTITEAEASLDRKRRETHAENLAAVAEALDTFLGWGDILTDRERHDYTLASNAANLARQAILGNVEPGPVTLNT